MNSPFPGMDPYLEHHWRSVHHRLITYSGDQLQAVLPSRFRVEVEERVFVAGEVDAARNVYPDAHVVDEGDAHGARPSAGGAPTITRPVVIELLDEPATETYLEIVDTASGNRVITAIEFLSPTNKRPGDGNEMYVRKQREYRAAGVSQVEIDLTRQGDRSLVMPIVRIPPEHRTLYAGCVRRGWQPQKLEAYPMPLRQPLPTIGVPLDASNEDVPLPLQTLVAQCYANGQYDRGIDYQTDPHPPLPPDDRAWAEELLHSKGLRRPP
jgi:hypothetical protein